MTDLMIEYALAMEGNLCINPKQLLDRAQIAADVAYLGEINVSQRLATITYDEGTYTEEQILTALIDAYPVKVTDGGASFYSRMDDALRGTVIKASNSGALDPEVLQSFYYPKNWSKAAGMLLEKMPPYYATRSLTNEYEALTAEGKAAFEERYQVGQVNRWNTIYGLIIFIRTAYQEDPADWATWDADHPNNTKADLMEAMNTVYSWMS